MFPDMLQVLVTSFFAGRRSVPEMFLCLESESG